MAANKWTFDITRTLFLLYAAAAFVRGEGYCSCTSSSGKGDREYCNYDCCGDGNTNCSTVCCKFSLPGLIVGILLLLVFVIVLFLLIRTCWKHHQLRKGVVINRLANEGVSSQIAHRYICWFDRLDYRYFTSIDYQVELQNTAFCTIEFDYRYSQIEHNKDPDLSQHNATGDNDRKRKKKVAPDSDSQTDARRNMEWTPHSTSPPPPPAYGYYPAQLGPDKPSYPNYPPLPSVIY